MPWCRVVQLLVSPAGNGDHTNGCTGQVQPRRGHALGPDDDARQPVSNGELAALLSRLTGRLREVEPVFEPGRDLTNAQGPSLALEVTDHALHACPNDE
jgi:hypothetical protein